MNIKNLYLVKTTNKNNYGAVKSIIKENEYIIYFEKNNDINIYNDVKNIEIHYMNFLNIKYNKMIRPEINIYFTDFDKFEFCNKDELFLFINTFIKFINNNNTFFYSDFYNFNIIARIFNRNNNYTKIISNLTQNVNFYEFFDFILEDSMGLNNTNLNIYNFAFYLYYINFIKKDKRIINCM